MLAKYPVAIKIEINAKKGVKEGFPTDSLGKKI